MPDVVLTLTGDSNRLAGTDDSIPGPPDEKNRRLG
jgi:hypothetical protein